MLLWSHPLCFLHVAYTEFDSKRIILAVSGHRPCRSHLLQEALPELRVLAVLPLGSFPMLPLGCLMHSPLPHPAPPLAMELAETRPDESLSSQHLYLRSLRVLVRKALIKSHTLHGIVIFTPGPQCSLFPHTGTALATSPSAS